MKSKILQKVVLVDCNMFFIFGTEKKEEQLKKTPCMIAAQIKVCGKKRKHEIVARLYTLAHNKTKCGGGMSAMTTCFFT